MHMGRFRFITATLAAAALFTGAVPAAADEDEFFTGCESGPILGWNPQIRKICDGPIRTDGTWLRWRQLITLDKTRSSCGGIYYEGGNCPPWNNQQDFIPGGRNAEMYYLTVDTIPPGEPGHLDNPVRCGVQGYRCDVP